MQFRSRNTGGVKQSMRCSVTLWAHGGLSELLREVARVPQALAVNSTLQLNRCLDPSFPHGLCARVLTQVFRTACAHVLAYGVPSWLCNIRIRAFLRIGCHTRVAGMGIARRALLAWLRTSNNMADQNIIAMWSLLHRSLYLFENFCKPSIVSLVGPKSLPC